MSYPSDFISELTCAANELDKLSVDEYRCLVKRAVRVAREMSLAADTRARRGNSVAVRDLEIAALMVEAAADNNEAEDVLLNLVGMIRALQIIVDGKTETRDDD
ncbi:hypothetical protein CO662_22895 [Rhizobium anhuiense]|uniref:Uncharacterized protein n=1 Tax=Rhizobium anhuiense TaxID=1184720 RepID=A0ABX4J370_9HYPH|nr:hypothetical protein [Rhizobium anhuiense]PDS41183.1 hypothetical protein CO668_30015 [Rhizobium anhuiense]PDS49643.1 hypothetical protein CO662_22895 [Rhizobium anhuiense]